ncbi:MAG: MFS transporter [Acidobacteria bacterium]|nr:MFS transporter [Acidobacteriota bacterium]
MTPATSTPQKPTRARHWVIVFAITLSIITYIDRVCISQAAPLMRKDLGLSAMQMGGVFAAFAWAYALFEIPGGWLGDWLGPRRVLMRIVIWWSFFTAATGWVWNYVSLWVMRFLFGAGEAGCFPNLTKAFTTWLPQHERVRAQGIMWMSARWGGAFTPVLVVWVFQFMSWRRAFEMFGAIGVVWAVCFFRWYRDNPRDHKSVNQAELALLQGAEHTASGHGDVPWGKLLGSLTVWMLWWQYFWVSYTWFFFISWLPTYLQEGRGLTPEYAAKLAIFPLFFGGLGCIFSGFLNPYVARWMGSVAKARRLIAFLGTAGAFLMVLLHIQIRNPLWAMLALGMASFFNDVLMPGSWGACMDVGGKYAGTLSGSMNMMGNFGSAVSPLALGYLMQLAGDWQPGFYSMACAYVLAGVSWLFIDPVTPLEERGRKH